MKKYILLALLVAPLSFNNIHGYGCCGGGSGAGWGVGAGLLGLGLGTAIASRPRRETVVYQQAPAQQAPAQQGKIIAFNTNLKKTIPWKNVNKYQPDDLIFIDTATNEEIPASNINDYTAVYG